MGGKGKNKLQNEKNKRIKSNFRVPWSSTCERGVRTRWGELWGLSDAVAMLLPRTDRELSQEAGVTENIAPSGFAEKPHNLSSCWHVCNKGRAHPKSSMCKNRGGTALAERSAITSFLVG